MTELREIAARLETGFDRAAKAMTADEIAAFLEGASAAYYNQGEPILADDLFDKLKDRLKRRAPKHPYLKRVGARTDQAKVELPFYLGSLDKIREDPRALARFVRDYPGEYVVMDKLDGNSALVVYAAGSRVPSAIYSRGDGFVGQDVSHLIPFIQGLPERSGGGSAQGRLAIRGELIIARADWRGAEWGANARNVVAGIMHTTTLDARFKTIARHIRFVAYDVLEGAPPGPGGISNALQYLENDWAGGGTGTGAGFVVWNRGLTATDLTMDQLSELLIQRRRESPYEVDGIVIMQDAAHPLKRGKNPGHGFAFKSILTHDSAEVIVSDVEWKVSKDGFIKPTVVFDPVVISGASISRATGFNAAFIERGRIGPGSRIRIIRSGDVIPKIEEILAPAANGRPAMPEGEWEWNETRVDARIKAAETTPEAVALQRLIHFAEVLDIKFVSEGIIRKLYDAGAIRGAADLFRLSVADLEALPGFKRTLSEKIVASIAETRASGGVGSGSSAARSGSSAARAARWMAASSAFGRGFGMKKLAAILAEFPQCANGDCAIGVEAISGLKGFSQTTAEAFLAGLAKYRRFVVELGLNFDADAGAGAAAESRGPGPAAELAGKAVVFTGFRNADWESVLEAAGVRVGSSVSKQTALVVAADPDAANSKLTRARELGIRILDRETFRRQFALPTA